MRETRVWCDGRPERGGQLHRSVPVIHVREWLMLIQHYTRTGATMSATQSPQIDWSRDVDATLAHAKQEHKPVLLDFTAAPQ